MQYITTQHLVFSMLCMLLFVTCSKACFPSSTQRELASELFIGSVSSGLTLFIAIVVTWNGLVATAARSP